MRKMAFISRALALAEPVPLTVASFRVKSLTRVAVSVPASLQSSGYLPLDQYRDLYVGQLGDEDM